MRSLLLKLFGVRVSCPWPRAQNHTTQNSKTRVPNLEEALHGITVVESLPLFFESDTI